MKRLAVLPISPRFSPDIMPSRGDKLRELIRLRELRRKELYSAGSSIQSPSTPSTPSTPSALFSPSAPSAPSAPSLPTTYDHTRGRLGIVSGFVVTLGLLFPGSHPAFALSSRSVFEGDVTKGIDLKVWPGYGLTINLLPTHAIIKQAWLGHPGRFLLSSNGSLCPQSLSSQTQSCKNTGASVVFLRLIDPKTFNNPDLPPSAVRQK